MQNDLSKRKKDMQCKMDENEKDQLTHTGSDTLLIVKALKSTDFTFLDLGLKNSFLFLFLFWVVVWGGAVSIHV